MLQVVPVAKSHADDTTGVVLTGIDPPELPWPPPYLQWAVDPAGRNFEASERERNDRRTVTWLRGDRYPVKQDLYLDAAALFDVGIADAAVAEFMTAYGPMTVDPAASTGHRRGEVAPAHREPLLGLARYSAPAFQDMLRRPGHATWWLAGEDVALAFMTIAWLVDSWRELQGDGERTDLMDTVETLMRPSGLAPDVGGFSAVLDSCLRPLSPRIGATYHTDLPLGEHWLADYKRPPTLSLLAAQLWTHIRSGRTIRSCKNIKCGKLFEFQEDVVKDPNRKRRPDALYCSQRCGTQQRQREWRERKRAAHAV